MSIDETTTAAAPARRGRAARATAVGSGAVLVGGAASALLAALAASPGGAIGTTLTVDSLGDGAASGAHCVDGTASNCTLRDALAEALDGDTIVFAPSVVGVITLTNGTLPVNHGVTITGPGVTNLTIDADELSRVFTIGPVTSAVSISGLTVTNGRTSNSAALQRERSGGGIYAVDATAPVTLSNLIITNNTAASGLGGGVFFSGSSSFSMIDCVVSGNAAQSGRGGGMFVTGFSQAGSVLVRNTTVVGNRAVDTGGMYFQFVGPVEIDNSTVTLNEATTGKGGGILAYATPNLVINQSTIANNLSGGRGGGLALELAATLTGTIVSGNHAGVAGTDDLGAYGGPITVTSSGSLFFSVDPNVTVSGSGNLTGVDPQLGSLADNGGPTPTLALAAGSPAIDAGPNPVATFPGNGNDQRGVGFSRVVGGRVDIGAFEYGAVAPTTTTTSTTSTTTSTTTPGGQVVPTITG